MRRSPFRGYSLGEDQALSYFFDAFLVPDFATCLVFFSAAAATSLPASAAPVTAPSAAPLSTDFKASLAFARIPEDFLPLFLPLADLPEVFLVADEADFFLAGFFVGMSIPSFVDSST